MTSTVSAATTAVLLSSTYDALSTTVGIALVIALAILLFQREVTRILGGHRAVAWEWAFDVALIPLIFVFFVIVAARLIELIV
jgi:hypothetical protein